VGYLIEEGIEAQGGQAIVCLGCGRKSHHPEDVANLYCGNCRGTHDLVATPRVADGMQASSSRAKLALHRVGKAAWVHGSVVHKTSEGGVVYVGCSCGVRFWPPGS